jgi:hypothetical protein
MARYPGEDDNDGVLATFDSPVRAIRVATALAERDTETLHCQGSRPRRRRFIAVASAIGTPKRGQVASASLPYGGGAVQGNSIHPTSGSGSRRAGPRRHRLPPCRRGLGVLEGLIEEPVPASRSSSISAADSQVRSEMFQSALQIFLALHDIGVLQCDVLVRLRHLAPLWSHG